MFQVSNEDCARCVLEAIDVGYRLINTAQAYHNEEAVGSAVKRCALPRDQLFLTIKIWISNSGYETAETSLRESLRKLQTDYICLLYTSRCV